MPVILFTLLLGHALGDFYFQSDRIAQEKKQKLGVLLLHILIYAIVMAAVLLAGIQLSQPLLIVMILVVVIHGIIDIGKFFLIRIKFSKSFGQTVLKYSFFIDQILHLAALLAIGILFKDKLVIYPYQTTLAILPVAPIALFTGLAYLLKPASTLIGEFFQASGLRETIDQADGASPRSFVRAGKIIGMLERTLVYVLILANQYSAIGFIITAKTITRFKELEKREVAEYYLIGTLLSMAITFGVGWICK
jgi:hypothetical protein